MVEKKGQAAMEFLMTYGWALLVVLVAIGALAFFGVLNPGQFLPSSCTITPGIACSDFQVTTDTDGTIILNLQNGMGNSLTVVSVSSTGAGCTASGDMADGALVQYVLTGCTDVGVSGSKIKADITVAYTLGTSGLPHSKTGQLVTQVE